MTDRYRSRISPQTQTLAQTQKQVQTSSSKLSGLSWMLIMAGFAVALKLSVLGIPFSYFTTYLHELGHGLVAVLVGGEIDRIELNLDGSGACYYWARSHVLPALAGYALTPIFGALVFMLGLGVRDRNSHIKYWLAVGVLGAMFSVGVFHIRDLVTLLILAGLMTTIAAALYWPRYGYLFLKFIGIFMMVDVFAKASYLFDYSDKGDHHTLWQLTGIPMSVWIFVWFVISLVTLCYTVWMLYRLR